MSKYESAYSLCECPQEYAAILEYDGDMVRNEADKIAAATKGLCNDCPSQNEQQIDND